MDVAVIGGGSWGTALARLLARKACRRPSGRGSPRSSSRSAPNARTPCFFPVSSCRGRSGPPMTSTRQHRARGRRVHGPDPTHPGDVRRKPAPLRAAEILVSVSKGIEVETLQTPAQILERWRRHDWPIGSSRCRARPSHTRSGLITRPQSSPPEFARAGPPGTRPLQHVIVPRVLLRRHRVSRTRWCAEERDRHRIRDVLRARIRAELQGCVDHPRARRDHPRRRGDGR